jgi:carboxylesterase type B
MHAHGNIISFSHRYSKASDQRASFGDKFVSLANCTKGDLVCLQNLDPFVATNLGDKATGAVGANIFDRILEGGRVEDAFAMQWSPVVDAMSTDLPDQPLKLMADGKWTPVPVLLGSNQDEGATFVYAGVPVKLPEALFPIVNDVIFGATGDKVAAAAAVAVAVACSTACVGRTNHVDQTELCC